MPKYSIVKDGMEFDLGEVADYTPPILDNSTTDRPYFSCDKYRVVQPIFETTTSFEFDIDALDKLSEELKRMAKRESPVYSATIAQGIEKFIKEKGERPTYLFIHPNDFAEIAIESTPYFMPSKGDDDLRPKFMDVCVMVTPYVPEKNPVLIGNEQAQEAERLINAPNFPSAREYVRNNQKDY